MCSIFGGVGELDVEVLGSISNRARDRGRDGGKTEDYVLADGTRAVLGNWRATPTTEVAVTDLQPYDGVVHNGTIANDKELGNPPGQVDSKVIPRVVDRSSLESFAASLGALVGSYAVAVRAGNTVYLACNYKPIYFCKIGGAVYFSSMERHFEGVVGHGLRPSKVPPYTAMDLRTGVVVPLPVRRTGRAVVSCSGGLDSTCVAQIMKDRGHEVHLLHFDYGCRATALEVARVERIARALGCTHQVVPLAYSHLKGGSPLFDSSAISGPVAGAEFAHEWVPARNLLMLAYSVAFAEANGYEYVAIGNNLEESGAYPDNEEELTHLFNALLPHAVRAGQRVEVVWPVGSLMKAEIVREGVSRGDPFEHTWSCYNAGEVHCGSCGPCYMRRVAFHRNGLVDPVPYAVPFSVTGSAA